MFGKLRD